MIDESTKTIYVDHSTLAVFKACKEKCRLGSVQGWRSKERKASLDFGHAIHAGWEAYYDALAGGWHDKGGKWHKFNDKYLQLADNVEATHQNIAISQPILVAQAAFLRDLGHMDAKLPVQIESEERRSLERGLYLLEAYVYRWRNEPYENILDVRGAPLTEVGFNSYVTTFEDYQVRRVGYIDRLMRNIMTKRPAIFEGKTTTNGLSQYVLQCKPNDQVTGYFPAAMAVLGGEEVKECVWDCVFISDRLPNMKKGLTDRWWAYGIDIDKDFARQITTRSTTDITAFKIDLEEDVLDYCKWILSGKTRWPRTAPGACHAFGGCQFRNRCSMNLEADQEQAFMESYFKIEKWEPWRKIVGKA